MFKLIVAHDVNFGISKNGNIPWTIPEDFKYFKNYTMGSVCIMGRITYLDLLKYVKPGNIPLPGREIIVLTSKHLDDVNTIRSLKDLNKLTFDKDVIICGGKSVYEESVKVLQIDEISCTEVQGDFDCDNQINPEMFSDFRIFKRFQLENTQHFVSIYKNIRNYK
jgi:dihydrofolate reductase